MITIYLSRFICMAAMLSFVVGWPLPVQADSSTIQVILSSEAEHYHRVFDTLSAELKKSKYKFVVTRSLAAENTFGQHNNSQNSLIVAVGGKACTESINNASLTPLLCTFLPKHVFEDTLHSYQAGFTRKPDSKRQISSIYLDQPWQRYLQLINIVLPDTAPLRTFSMAFTAEEQATLSKIQHTANILDLTLRPVNVGATQSAPRALTPALQNSQIFLATPGFMTQTAAKWLLYYSIRNKKPLIAYSRSWVKAGALAAVFSTPEDIARDISDEIIERLPHKALALNSPRYPNHFSVAVNHNVARSLNIRLLSKTKMEQLLDNYEASASSEVKNVQ